MGSFNMPKCKQRGQIKLSFCAEWMSANMDMSLGVTCRGFWACQLIGYCAILSERMFGFLYTYNYKLQHSIILHISSIGKVSKTVISYLARLITVSVGKHARFDGWWKPLWTIEFYKAKCISLKQLNWHFFSICFCCLLNIIFVHYTCGWMCNT